MPRKQVILKITAGDKIPKEQRWQLDSLRRITPVVGTEESYGRFVSMAEKRMLQQARFDQACDLHDKYMTDESRRLMKSEGKTLDQRIMAEMGALDRWRHACEHLHDKVAVPEEDVRNIVNMSMSDKLDGVDFKLNHGLLASKVAQVIRQNVTDFEGDVPFCKEHSA